FFFFFFSSRRRHTRCYRDWSSDVCSSDLENPVAGPPALLTAHGILLLFNAGNSGEFGDPTLPARVYTGGQALYDSRNPLKLIARSDAPFLRPTEDYERNGQYPAGTTFVEGLVPFHGRWYLSYGTADSRVGVAVG